MVADEEAVEKDDLIIIRLAMIMRVTNVLENAWWKYIRIRISIIRINPAMIDQFSVWQLLLPPLLRDRGESSIVHSP